MNNSIGNDIHNFASKLWRVNRSLTGEGVRQTLTLIKEHLPKLTVKSVPSGTQVFDWIVPPEWHVNEAYITTPNGDKICDFSVNNLHLVGYSIPYSGKITLSELQKHLHSLPEQPSAIPYITSYYEERWGFCLTQEQRDSLEEGEYKVVINSKLFSGQLNYGELILPGESNEEIFLSTYICHPSMANNELSGPTVVTYLAKWLSQLTTHRYTYRFIFIPETIGSITYLSRNYKHLKNNVVAGFNVSCVGDDRSYSYIPSRNGKTISDTVSKHVLKWIDPDYTVYSWLDRGSDERQYCAPGIDLPIASILRTKYGQYPEYHTSLDDFKLVSPEGLEGGYKVVSEAIFIIMNNYYPKNKIICEPNLGKRGLYSLVSSGKIKKSIKDLMNFLQYADGKNDLIDISNIIKIPFRETLKICIQLKEKKLIS